MFHECEENLIIFQWITWIPKIPKHLMYIEKTTLRLNSMRQRINTLAFCFGDISVPLVGVVFKHIDKKKTIILQKLIWRQICFAVASLILQCSFQIANVSQKRCSHVLFFDKITTVIVFILDLLRSYFDLLISSDSLIFLFLYLIFLDNVFECIQLNLWYSILNNALLHLNFAILVDAILLVFYCSG